MIAGITRGQELIGVSALLSDAHCLFISDIETMVGALTSDKTGKNLPEEYARWRALNGGRGIYVGSADDPIARRQN
jgi:hypothetical protein